MAASLSPARLQAWSESLSARERVLLLVVLLATLAFLADTFLLSPQKRQAQALQAQLAEQGARIAVLTQALATPPDPGEPAAATAPRAEPGALGDEVPGNEVLYARTLLQKARQEAGPGGMARSLIAQTRGVTLRSLQIRPVQPFLKPKAAPAASAAKQTAQALPPLYLHAVDISVDGSYDDVVRFLQRLEAQDRPYFWPSLSVTVIVPPLVSLRATLQTLSIHPEAPLE